MRYLRDLLDEAERLAPKPPKRAPPSSAESEDDNPIPEYILSLGRKDRIRDIAENLLANRPVDSSVLWELLAAVETAKSHSWKRGVVAAWSISRLQLTAGQRHDAASRLNAVLTRRVVGSGCLNPGTIRAMYFCTVAICAIVGIWASTRGTVYLSLAIYVIVLIASLCLIAAPIVLPLSITFDRLRNQRLQSQVAETLGVLGSPESLEALTEAGVEVASRASRPAREALVRVLPQMSEEWRGRLSAAAIQGLCKILSDAHGFAALVILRALERVGPGSAAASVDWAIKGWAHGPVRDEGERVLTVLRERLAKEKEAASLLRAASDSGETTLLRANPPAGDSTELLRPLDFAR